MPDELVDRNESLDQTRVLYHGASPDRWRKRGADILYPDFIGGCFMTPDPQLASMYAADWMSREDHVTFLQHVIDECFSRGDEEELLANGLIEDDEEGWYRRTAAADARWVLQHWNSFQISHYLVARSVAAIHHYTEGAVVFPLRLTTWNVRIFDCEGNHFDHLPGRIFGLPADRVSVDEVVEGLRGAVDAIWLMNLTDPAHATRVVPADTVFVYDAANISFAISGERCG